jgi:hypothetical protein
MPACLVQVSRRHITNLQYTLQEKWQQEAQNENTSQ